jgi:hypothetical protein
MPSTTTYRLNLEEKPRSVVKRHEPKTGIERCAIGVLDVLGMTGLLKSMPLSDIVEKVFGPFHASHSPTIVPEAAGVTMDFFEGQGFHPVADVYHFFIGDMIVMICPEMDGSDENSKMGSDATHVESIEEIVIAMGRTMARASRHGVYLRGAIASGECLISLNGDLVCLGLPLKEAAEWETAQEWSGAVLAPSAAALVDRYLTQESGPAVGTKIIVRYDAPTKLKKPSDFRPNLAVNWVEMGGLFTACAPKLEDFRHKPDDVRLKMRNTLAFFEEIHRRRERST